MAKPQAFLQTLAERLGVCPAGDRDRQTAQLWGCSASVASRRRAPAKSISEQSGGELASADATTRAADAAVQIIQTSPGLSFCSRIYLRPLPSPPTSTDCLRLSPEPVRRFQDLAQGDVQPTRRMIGAPCLRSVGCRRLEVNVTMPSAGPDAHALGEPTRTGEDTPVPSYWNSGAGDRRLPRAQRVDRSAR